MNPAYERVLNSMIQRAVLALSVWLTTKGALTSEEASSLVSPTVEIAAGLAGSAFVVIYGWIRARATQVKINTALAMSPMSEQQLDTKIASGVAAPASTPKDEQPIVTQA
jgi:hypothetical protein